MTKAPEAMDDFTPMQRELAADIPPWRIRWQEDDSGAVHWELHEAGERVSAWPEAAAPGLGAWLSVMLTKRHGVVRARFKDLGGKRAAGVASAKRRGAPQKRDAVLAKASQLRAARIDPLTKVGVIARFAGCTARYVRQVLNAPKEKRK